MVYAIPTAAIKKETAVNEKILNCRPYFQIHIFYRMIP